MIRSFNIALIAITGMTCLGLYRISDGARVADDDLRATKAAIARETQALAVLGAEWARLTQPGRIQALVNKHLDMSDKPVVELTSLSDLPLKSLPLAPEAVIRNANAELPLSAPLPDAQSTQKPVPQQVPASGFSSLQTGT